MTGLEGAPGQGAVADLAPLGRAEGRASPVQKGGKL
jgi:hypothetical protein